MRPRLATTVPVLLSLLAASPALAAPVLTLSVVVPAGSEGVSLRIRTDNGNNALLRDDGLLADDLPGDGEWVTLVDLEGVSTVSLDGVVGGRPLRWSGALLPPEDQEIGAWPVTFVLQADEDDWRITRLVDPKLPSRGGLPWWTLLPLGLMCLSALGALGPRRSPGR